MNEIFQNFKKLTSFNLGNFNTSKVIDTRYMFYDCERLTTIYVIEYNETTNTGWTTKNITNSEYMFSYCTSLVGENRTRYNTSYQDKEYVKIRIKT